MRGTIELLPELYELLNIVKCTTCSVDERCLHLNLTNKKIAGIYTRISETVTVSLMNSYQASKIVH